MDSAIQAFCQWLTQRHDLILGREKEAYACLSSGDKEGYAEKMREKATLLSTLARDATEVLKPLPEELRTEIRSALMRFSSSAAYGLKIGSVFYMSALLYKDEHPVGEPDNLQLFLEQVASQGMDFKG